MRVVDGKVGQRLLGKEVKPLKRAEIKSKLEESKDKSLRKVKEKV